MDALALVLVLVALVAVTVVLVLCIVWVVEIDKRNHLLSNWVRSHAPIPDSDNTVFGIFHPYANAGGGGERVLWCVVRALQLLNPRFDIVLYTGDPMTSDELIRRARSHFHVEIPRPIDVIVLKKRHLVEDKSYKRFTLLGQSLGSMFLAWEALRQRRPHVFVDTMGYAFTYPLAKIFFRCPVISYTHYPTISTDMLQRVRDRRPSYNNDDSISDSNLKTTAKLIYYYTFSWIYGFVGRFADLVMVNSTWTKGHIEALWHPTSGRCHIVYPPCNAEGISNFVDSNRLPRSRAIVSIAQFRPEKDHRLQVDSFARFLRFSEAADSSPSSSTRTTKIDSSKDDIRLILVGSARHADDQKRVDDLKARCAELNISDRVDFVVNAPFETIQQLLATSTIGLHSMWNEHFGIVLVEYMAAGLIVLGHNSAGPKMDILVPEGTQRTGFLASTQEEYATSIDYIFKHAEEWEAIRTAARNRIARFSEEAFESRVQQLFSGVLNL